jgi:hypothetical protein
MIDERSVFDLSPQISRASGNLFSRFRLLLMTGLLLATFLAALLAG